MHIGHYMHIAQPILHSSFFIPRSSFLQVLFSNHVGCFFNSFGHIIVNNTGSQYIQYILLVIQLERFDEATFKVLHIA